MKNGRRIAMIVIPPLLVVIYLFFNQDRFDGLNNAEREAKLVNIRLPAETKNIKFHIDKVQGMNLNGKAALSIGGWIFEEKGNREKRKVYLVLKSKNDTLIFEIKKDTLKRPDVTAAYKMVEGIDNHGFMLNLPMYRLQEDLFRIGFVVEDETGISYHLSDKALRISTADTSIIDFVSETLSPRVYLTIQKPTKEISYYFDTIERTSNSVKIRGWGFLQGLNAMSLKSYVLLKKTGKEHMFEVEVEERKDITRALGKNGINLDSTGFRARISTENLEAGNYELGLYITHGNQSGIIYSNKFIDIGN